MYNDVIMKTNKNMLNIEKLFKQEWYDMYEFYTKKKLIDKIKKMEEEIKRLKIKKGQPKPSRVSK